VSVSQAPRSGSKRDQGPKKELQRKEKALADAVALLVLRKKWEAYSFGEAFGYSSEDEEG
jgi:transposase